jgi:MoaA/NifB/PqqE/SkfB family radical SAM enzyme
LKQRLGRIIPGNARKDARFEPAPNLDELERSSERHMVLLVDVYDRCNLRCGMCGQWKGAESKPAARIAPELFERFAEAIFPRCRQVNLSCAYEPFTLPGFTDYLAVASRYKVPKLNLTTNASLLVRPVIERNVESGLPWLAVSVDGATRETYESIRVGASFDKLLANLATLAEAKREARSETPAIQFNWVLMERNLDEVVPFIRLAGEFAPRKFVFVHLDYAPPPESRRAKVAGVLRAALEACVRGGVLFEELPNHCLSLAEIGRAYGCAVREIPPVTPRCLDPWHMMRLLPNGDVLRCAVMNEPAGNIHCTDPARIWRGEAYTTLRKRWEQGDLPAVCRVCPYAPGGLVQSYRLREQMEQMISRQITLPQGQG